MRRRKRVIVFSICKPSHTLRVYAVSTVVHSPTHRTKLITAVAVHLTLPVSQSDDLFSEQFRD